jgi:hypothetical protein
MAIHCENPDDIPAVEAWLAKVSDPRIITVHVEDGAVSLSGDRTHFDGDAVIAPRTSDLAASLDAAYESFVTVVPPLPS